jgi:cyclic pyranopterin phosphate synthase
MEETTPMTFKPPPTIDLARRTLRYVRISVTDRCNFRCPYCRPDRGSECFYPPEDHLTAAEIGRLTRVLGSIGIDTVRFTGGEPLLRRDLPDVIRAVRTIGGQRDLALSTNAHFLARLAQPLADAGLERVNISLDTLDPTTFKRLSGGAPIEPVLEGIRVAIEAGISIKTNTVVVRGQNEHELRAIADFVWELGGTPRFIELMPIGPGGQLDMVPAAEILAQFEVSPDRADGQAGPGRGPAEYWRQGGDPGRVLGVIGATTRNFCQSCNRIRITATGAVRACLASADGVELRPLLRDPGSDDSAILARLQDALFGKSAGHRFSDGVGGENLMRAIGG